VDDVLLVRRREPLDELPPKVQYLLLRQRTNLDLVR